MRWQVTELAAIDAWRQKQDDKPSRPEAIRRLVEQALYSSADGRPANKRKALKSEEMADRTVETMGDKSMPAEEQDRRKRTLTRGPKEFREIREDQPKRRG